MSETEAPQTEIRPVMSGWNWRAWPRGRNKAALGGWAATKRQAEREAEKALEKYRT